MMNTIYTYPQERLTEEKCYTAVNSIIQHALATKEICPCTFCQNGNHTGAKCEKLEIANTALAILENKRQVENVSVRKNDEWKV